MQWAIATIALKCSAAVQAETIHQVNIGQIPSYVGHLPESKSGDLKSFSKNCPKSDYWSACISFLYLSCFKKGTASAARNMINIAKIAPLK